MQRWSAHSLRIGVCVIPHSMGLSEPQMKRLLRWRSGAFTVYLQNTAILANLNYETLDRVAGMPRFLHCRLLSSICNFADNFLRSSSLPYILKWKRAELLREYTNSTLSMTRKRCSAGPLTPCALVRV